MFKVSVRLLTNVTLHKLSLTHILCQSSLQLTSLAVKECGAGKELSPLCLGENWFLRQAFCSGKKVALSFNVIISHSVLMYFLNLRSLKCNIMGWMNVSRLLYKRNTKYYENLLIFPRFENGFPAISRGEKNVPLIYLCCTPHLVLNLVLVNMLCIHP